MEISWWDIGTTYGGI